MGDVGQLLRADFLGAWRTATTLRVADDPDGQPNFKKPDFKGLIIDAARPAEARCLVWNAASAPDDSLCQFDVALLSRDRWVLDIANGENLSLLQLSDVAADPESSLAPAA
jgi:hypothetical protein